MPVNSVSTDYSVYNNQVTTESNNDLDKDAFLKILTAQLQYQDPMESMDNSEYISQLAQFSSLEKMETLSDSINTLISLQNTQLGVSLIGKDIKVEKDGVMTTTTVEKVSNLKGELSIYSDGNRYNLDEILEIVDN